ncbi:MAG TPA: F0F1 ATP synthase subunit A [Prolixibacteraceae bacterium]|nr:F0F1 ATP synthase subunit A [Prolixibacteraceae bacterium]
MIRRSSILIIVLLVSSLCNYSRASDTGEKEFNAVEYIFEHVNDSHEWHFATVGDHHIAIPLPVILHSKHSGWHIFLSNKLHHPGEHFPFQLAHGGPNDGKIIEIMEDGSELVPFDVSLTKSVLGAIIVSLLLLILFIRGSRKTIANPMMPPKGIQNLVEPLVLFIRDEVAKPFAGKKYKRYVPFLLTLFHFILAANLIGLILPLGFNITGNIAVTLTLAAFTFIITSISGNRHYWKHIINPDVPIFMKLPIPLMPIIEIAGIFIKPVVLMIRLFANMFAGHIIVSVLISLIFIMSTMLGPAVGAGTSVISILFSVFMLMLDILVSFIQAYIFTLLSASYFGMATAESEH